MARSSGRSRTRGTRSGATKVSSRLPAATTSVALKMKRAQAKGTHLQRHQRHRRHPRQHQRRHQHQHQRRLQHLAVATQSRHWSMTIGVKRIVPLGSAPVIYVNVTLPHSCKCCAGMAPFCFYDGWPVPGTMPESNLVRQGVRR